MDTQELFNFGVNLMKAQAGQFEEREAQLERTSLSRKVDEIEKRMEDQAKEIEGLKNGLCR